MPLINCQGTRSTRDKDSTNVIRCHTLDLMTLIDIVNNWIKQNYKEKAKKKGRHPHRVHPLNTQSEYFADLCR